MSWCDPQGVLGTWMNDRQGFMFKHHQDFNTILLFMNLSNFKSQTVYPPSGQANN